ncbi:DUF4189 domain-containing protein [Mycobacterium asiaticum]|uniref:DUF4189 domain-containing protein n=1 Tax=Mycobacterium asiaticum TaxID=1790 RepID=A0A1A3NAD1_MYCAS|nr:DUF4189 domain-containing protein [Mycobacterium asiaticum]OBK18751.1 hypothetical protein A5636_02485 [Mycobacterium asiaticum]
MTTRQRRRVALTLASLLAACAMAFTVVHPASARTHQAPTPAAGTTFPSDAPTNLPPLLKHYGAFAYSPDGSSGVARRHKSKLGAQQEALERCGTDSCTVVSTFTHCGAVAHDGASYHGGVGMSRTAAEAHAVSELGGGWIVTSVCN